jgi:glycine/D-amino acid oxidase-like deaminating enzyme
LYSCAEREKLEAETRALQRIGCCAQLQDDLPLPMSTVGGVKVEGQAQFHPLKFVSKIAEGLQIYENTKALELVPDGAITDKGKIQAEKIIVATHFPFLNKHGMYFMKLFQHRSYVLALKNAADIGGMYVDADPKGMSFRNYKDMLLLGGGAHRTGRKGGCWQELEQFSGEYYPNAEIVTKWATQDCMTLDGIPYIGQYSKNTPNLYVATGFNKWGMTSSMVAATILCDLVKGKRSDYAHIFAPSRSMLHPQLMINAFESITGLLTPTAPRCPHLGCALKYNKAEHTWDCACHGSRFSEQGELLNNPATGNKKFK